jgi:hypothetical protein
VERIRFRPRDGVILALLSAPLGAVGFILVGFIIAMVGPIDPSAWLGAIIGLIFGPVCAIGGGLGLALARLLKVRSPLAVTIMTGGGGGLWLFGIYLALFHPEDAEQGYLWGPLLLIGTLVAVGGFVWSGLIFGTFVAIRLSSATRQPIERAATDL